MCCDVHDETSQSWNGQCFGEISKEFVSTAVLSDRTCDADGKTHRACSYQISNIMCYYDDKRHTHYFSQISNIMCYYGDKRYIHTLFQHCVTHVTIATD